jgi:hypothetical protein
VKIGFVKGGAKKPKNWLTINIIYGKMTFLDSILVFLGAHVLRGDKKLPFVVWLSFDAQIQ